jgi:phage N-6-adenine-methyltransferase
MTARTLASGLPLTSLSGEWATPAALFAEYDREFRFTLDVCASADNTKCARFLTREDDGLAQSWVGEVCWMNPPYGRELPPWIERAALAARHEGATVVALVPARTDVRWWHQHVWDAANHRPRPGVEPRFLPGRIRFGDSAGGSAPFPTVATVFRPTGEAV